MANATTNGFGWQRRPQKEEEEEEEEEEQVAGGDDDLERDPSPNGSHDMGESRLVGHVDRWNISSSSPEVLDDLDLLQELKDYQDLLEENEQDYDFGELQDFEGLRKGDPPAEYLEGEEIQEELSPLSYWRPKTDQWLGFPEDNQERDCSEGQEKPGGAWDSGSEGEPYPELSYEGQYGSEFSTSPEGPRDPRTLYKRSKSYSFTLDGGEEELLENSNLRPSPSGPNPEHVRLKMDILEIQGLHGESQGFPGETEFSSPSERSHNLSSPTASVPWHQDSLGRPFVERLQTSPSLDADTFPESSWMETTGQPEETVLKMASSGTVQTGEPEQGLLDVGEATETPPALRQVGYWQPGRAQKLKADIPHGLPSKFNRQSRSLSPQGRASQRKAGGSASRQPEHSNQLTTVTSDPLPYGRGQLNYPLPDLSKVEPRVKFPKDSQSYHPPRGKTLPARSKDPGKPVIFKSPAEIVREVLLSSGEGSPKKYIAPTISVIPEELKSPRQATELVHQLQEDYHKLLTKYAEAENTIDRLRLGAKVRLYADPPKPSHGVQMGTVSQPSKVMTFSIPQVRASEVTMRPGPGPEPTETKGFSGQPVASSSLPSSSDPGVSRLDGSTSTDKAFTGDELTQLLAAQAKKFRTQVDYLEELIRTGRLTPQDQLKGFARLKEAQDALEQAYLQARDEHQLRQQHQDPAGGGQGDFDPHRVVEGEIFHLGMRLEELKEKLGQAVSNPPRAQDVPDATLASSPHLSEAQMGSPTPSLQAPIPAVRTPYPEVPGRGNSHYRAHVDGEVSSVSDEMTEEEDALPEPLSHMHLQVEKDFDHLLGHYSSFKSLPEAMSMEKLYLDEPHFSPDEADGAAMTKNPGTKEESLPAAPKERKALRISSSAPTKGAQPARLLPRKPQRPPYQVEHVPSAQKVTSEETTEKSRTSGAGHKGSSRGQQDQLSPRSSVASVVDGAVLEHVSPKPFQKTNMVLSENLRIVSPETDSGFVGSEASRMSPLARIPKHRSSHLRSHGMLEESPPTNGAHQPDSLKKEPVVMEPPKAGASSKDRLPEGGPKRRSLSKRIPFRIRSPRQTRNSIPSEMEPGSESSHTNSEAEVESPKDELRSRHGTYSPHPDERSYSPSSSATSLSPSRTHYFNLLDSRLERDQAIAALQDEVSHLRQSLEETLHGPYGYPKHSSSPRASKRQTPLQGTARFSTSANPMRKPSGKITVASRDLPPVLRSEGQMKRSSFPQGGAQENLTPSESDYSTPKPQKGRKEEISVSTMNTPKQPILRGPYTGTPYIFPTPEPPEPRIVKGTSPCSHCQEAKSPVGEVLASDPGTNEAEGSGARKDSFGTSQYATTKRTETPKCLFFKEAGKHKTDVVHGQNHAREDTQAQNSGPQQKPGSHQQLQPPGFWYTTAVPPQVPTIGYIPTLAPCPLSSIIYCSPLGTTSASSTPAGLLAHNHGRLKTRASWQRPPADPRCSSVVDSDDSLQDLNWSLNRAMEVAKDMKLTTRRMSRYLTWELSKARSLRGSCRF